MGGTVLAEFIHAPLNGIRRRAVCERGESVRGEEGERRGTGRGKWEWE